MAERTRIKICGLRTPGAAETALEAGADMVGLVFAERSPRCVNEGQARAVAEVARGRAEVVGLFVGAEPAAVRRTCEAVGLSMLQMHGDLSLDAAKRLAPMPYMRAMAFEADQLAGDIALWDRIRADDHPPAALLIDAPDPRKIGGGTGRTFDWRALGDVLTALRPERPIVLAGGLTADNVAEAIGTVRPWMVDVSSGVESSRGVKDPSRIVAFCEAVRASDGP